MNLKLAITHGINKTMSIEVQVGKGCQSFKWLALMAAERFAMEFPNGRLRHREKTAFIDAGRKRAQLLPKSIYTDNCPFFCPEDKLNQHLKHGDKVTIDLYDCVHVDEFGAPKYSDWSIIAFQTNEAGRDKREKLADDKMLQVEEVRKKRELEEKERQLEMNRPHILFMKEVMKEQLVDDEIILETTQKEWDLILNSGILEHLVPELEEQRKIFSFLTEYYTEISDMYKYYSAINSGGGTHTLEYIEFSKFLCETDILQTGEHSNVILKIFLESHIGGEDSRGNKVSAASIHSEIHQHEFFVSLIRIAVYKYITLTKKELAMKKKKGHQASISKATTPTQSQALSLLYQDYLKPVIKKLPAGAAMKAALGSDEVLLLLHRNLEDLSRIFCRYAECDINANDVTGSAHTGMMNVKQFCTFATDAEFLGISEMNSQEEVTLKDARQIFSASQHDTAMNEEEIRLMQEKGGDANSHQEQMVIAEFLEAIARLGVIKFSKSGSSVNHFECIDLALKKTCSLLHRQ